MESESVPPTNEPPLEDPPPPPSLPISTPSPPSSQLTSVPLSPPSPSPPSLSTLQNSPPPLSPIQPTLEPPPQPSFSPPPSPPPLLLLVPPSVFTSSSLALSLQSEPWSTSAQSWSEILEPSQDPPQPSSQPSSRPSALPDQPLSTPPLPSALPPQPLSVPPSIPVAEPLLPLALTSEPLAQPPSPLVLPCPYLALASSPPPLSSLLSAQSLSPPLALPCSTLTAQPPSPELLESFPLPVPPSLPAGQFPSIPPMPSSPLTLPSSSLPPPPSLPSTQSPFPPPLSSPSPLPPSLPSAQPLSPPPLPSSPAKPSPPLALPPSPPPLPPSLPSAQPLSPPPLPSSPAEPSPPLALPPSPPPLPPSLPPAQDLSPPPLPSSPAEPSSSPPLLPPLPSSPAEPSSPPPLPPSLPSAHSPPPLPSSPAQHSSPLATPSSPPLPPSLPFAQPPSPPPSPPPLQTSSQNSDGLDFDSDIGENRLVCDQEMLSNGASDSSASEMQRDADLANTIERKRKAPGDEQSCKRPKLSEDVNDCDQPLPNNAQLLTRDGNSSRPLEDKQEFEIIDDIGSDDEGPVEYDSDFDEDDIDALLDQMLHNKPQGNSGSNEEDEFAAPVEREKIVLKERGQDPFDILPEGWVTVTHSSGMPVYLHKLSRVCTMSRPYFLGPGSCRKHDIPLSAVPCLEYRRELLKEELRQGKQLAKETVNGGNEEESMVNGAADEDMEEGELESNNPNVIKNEESLPNGAPEKEIEGQPEEKTNVSNVNNVENKTCPVDNDTSQPDESSQENINGDQNPIVRVESLEKYNKDKTLGALELRDYCKNLFEFQTITIKKYKTWKDRRKHHKLLKHRPSLPSNTKLITCPIPTNKQEDKPNRKKEFVLNPAGKSDICILHEYVQHAMRVQPRYVIKELENAQTPYSATVIISNVEYGSGYASSKKAAKNEAAKATLGILIPDLKKQTENNQDIHDLSFFDQVKIEDPRVHDLCNKAGQPGPFQILCECLRRNFGMGDTNCEMTMKTLKHQKSEFTMRVGKHSAQVICKNKREGKQFAAQAILQSLHPHIHNWGSLLRLYGIDWKAIKEKEEELSVTSLHAKAKQNQPNTAILNKLREEMQKLQLRRLSLIQSLDLAVSENIRKEVKSKLVILHQTIEDDLPTSAPSGAVRMRSDILSLKAERSLKKSLSLLGSAYLKATAYIENFSQCPICGPPLSFKSTEENSSQTEEKIQPPSLPKEERKPISQMTQTSVRINKEHQSQTDLSLVHETGMTPDILLRKVKRMANPKSTLSGLCDCMKKILVEQASQCDPLPGIALKSEDKSTQYPDLHLPLQSSMDQYSSAMLAVQQVHAYGQAALASLPSPYLVTCPPVMPAPTVSPVPALPAESRLVRNEPGNQEYAEALSNAALSELEAAEANKPKLESFQAYWRATPTNYVPQDILVNAGIVPPEKRCWRATVPLAPSATLVTGVSNQGRSAATGHSIPDRTTFESSKESDYYPNPYHVQRKDQQSAAGNFGRSLTSPPPATKRSTPEIGNIKRKPGPEPLMNAYPRKRDKPARSPSPANTINDQVCNPQQTRNRGSQGANYLQQSSRSQEVFSGVNTGYGFQDIGNTSLGHQPLWGVYGAPPPPPGPYQYSNYGPTWHWQ